MTLKEVILLTHKYYHPDRSLEDAVLLMYAEDLKDLDEKACIDAYDRWRRNPANRAFPMPAQIRELVNPEQFVAVEAKAREIAARIIGAVSRFGWNNGKEAELYIGLEGWAAVQTLGGWAFICENLGTKLNPSTLQAQLRDQVEGALRYGRPALEESIGVLPANSHGKLTLLGDIIKSIPKPGDDPGAA